MTLRLIAIGALGNMLAPSAKHLHNDSSAQFIRVLDRGHAGKQRDIRRHDWRAHGATLVNDMASLIGDGDFDGIIICAGKNGDDYAIITTLITQLKIAAPTRQYFILHCSTVSCDFVKATWAYCQKNQIQYANYPLTGGAKGAELGNILILASGDHALYQRVKPFLEKIGAPHYFGTDVTQSAAVKLIGHVMLFHNLFGLSLAVNLHKNIEQADALNPEQVPFFDFLIQGAGGSRQWELVMRQALADAQWDNGFLLHHALIDTLYTIDLLRTQPLPRTLLLPLLELAVLFTFALKKETMGMATQSIARLIAETPPSVIDPLIHAHLSLDIEQSLTNCIHALPETLQKSLMLTVNYPEISANESP